LALASLGRAGATFFLVAPRFLEAAFLAVFFVAAVFTVFLRGFCLAAADLDAPLVLSFLPADFAMCLSRAGIYHLSL